jgi:hypothetical protein
MHVTCFTAIEEDREGRYPVAVHHSIEDLH